MSATERGLCFYCEELLIPQHIGYPPCASCKKFISKAFMHHLDILFLLLKKTYSKLQPQPG